MDNAHVDEAMARIARLPLEERRAAYFAELDRIPLNTPARFYMVSLRMIFAPGMYENKEFHVLAGVVYGGTPLTEDKILRLEEHAAAVTVLLEAKDNWRESSNALARARRAVGPQDSAGGRSQTPAQQAVFQEALDAHREAHDLFEDASALEVAARPHQPRKMPSSPEARLGLIARARRALSS